MFRMRIFWVRLFWFLFALAYGVLVYTNNQKLYLASGKEKYYSALRWRIYAICVSLEYLFVGSLECFIKMMSRETLVDQLKDYGKQKLSCTGKKLLCISFHSAMIAYALRNFTMALYFALLSAFVAVDDVVQNPLSGFILIFQVNLSIMRKSFFSFFLKVFMLSNGCVEEKDLSKAKPVSKDSSQSINDSSSHTEPNSSGGVQEPLRDDYEESRQ